VGRRELRIIFLLESGKLGIGILGWESECGLRMGFGLRAAVGQPGAEVLQNSPDDLGVLNGPS
jgi:hypothetical protein